MEFAELRERIFDLYFKASYAEGLVVVEKGRQNFPEEDSILTFYEACLISLDGDPDQALSVLEAGLDRGLGWHPAMLSDADLDAARGSSGWERFVQRSAARVAEWEMDHPDPFVRIVPDATGTLVALPGVGNPDHFVEVWRPAIPTGWTFIVPVGEVPLAKGEWAWPFDLATGSLVDAIVTLPLTPPVVFSGYSQGSNLAAKAVWGGDVEATGLMLMAGPSPNPWPTSEQVPVPAYIFVGSDDGALDGCISTEESLSRAGVPNALNVREGLGHDLPEDLDQVVATGLEWILSQAR